MALLLGRLAGAAAHHWKRSRPRRRRRARRARRCSPRTGSGFSDDFSTPGHRVPAGVRPARRALPGAGRRHRDRRLLRRATARCATAERGRPRSPRRSAAIAGQPHVTGAPTRCRRGPGLARRADRASRTVQYDAARRASSAPAPGERLADVAAITERAGIEIVAQRPDRRPGRAGDGAGRRADRRRGGDHRAHARVPLGAPRCCSRSLSAGIALAGGMLLLTFGTRFADFPSFAPTLGVMLGLGAGIDYALLIVGRYREQLAAGDDVRQRRARRQRDRRHVGGRRGRDRRRRDRRPARHGHPVRRADGRRLGDRRRRRRGRRGHRAARC